jgi:hypothetical protein
MKTKRYHFKDTMIVGPPQKSADVDAIRQDETDLFCLEKTNSFVSRSA